MFIKLQLFQRFTIIVPPGKQTLLEIRRLVINSYFEKRKSFRKISKLIFYAPLISKYKKIWKPFKNTKYF